jgi:hypothetical protein
MYVSQQWRSLAWCPWRAISTPIRRRISIQQWKFDYSHIKVGKLSADRGQSSLFRCDQELSEPQTVFNWFDPEKLNNCFIAGARKSPSHTEIFWILRLKVATNLGNAAKEIFEAETSAEIDALRQKKIKLEFVDDCDTHYEESELHYSRDQAHHDYDMIMVDTICFMAVYSHNYVFEQRVSLGRRSFREQWRRVLRLLETLSYWFIKQR